MNEKSLIDQLPPDLREAHEVLAAGAAQILPSDGLAERLLDPLAVRYQEQVPNVSHAPRQGDLLVLQEKFNQRGDGPRVAGVGPAAQGEQLARRFVVRCS